MPNSYDPQLDAFELYHLSQEDPPKPALLSGPALPALGHAVSGAAGAAISTVLTYPLSLVITRLQVQRHLRRSGVSKDTVEYRNIEDALRKIYATEGGISAFYAGALQDTAKCMTDSFLFFLAYNVVRAKRLHAHGTKKLPVHEELLVGMLAGAISRFFTTPVQNIVTRKQTAAMVDEDTTRQTTRDIAREIHREKGIAGFWAGYSATLVLTLNPALTFVLQSVLLRVLVGREKRDAPGARITFLVAAVSKAMASCVTYPFSLAKARTQVEGRGKTATSVEKDSVVEEAEEGAKEVGRTARENVFTAVLRIAREEGVGALYQGLSGEVLKGFFSHGLTMLMKERIHAVIIQVYYVVLKLLRRYPNPEEMALAAKEQARETAGNAGAKVVAAGVSVSNAVQGVVEKGQEVMEGAKDKGQEVLGEVKDKGQEILEEAKVRGQDALDKGTERIGFWEDRDIWDDYLDPDDE
ncbi:mitochondrial carrier [Trichodelitschia bisporula]|uniref:Mitochondrial carrier n=1 Tax=Trichodelitschia bisporula TaxID=703511 RepID=A0A6G1HQM8_9PEZI|nr:mitochondrial carrier [Trichodelitschia bisporula]